MSERHKALGEGSRWGLNIHYSQEPEGALDTGGGIQQALPLLGDSPFAVINGDVFTQYPLGRLRAVKCSHSHLVLVPNPAHNPDGDFFLKGGYVLSDGQPRLTFSGISVYHPRFFQTWIERRSLGRVYRQPWRREPAADTKAWFSLGHCPYFKTLADRLRRASSRSTMPISCQSPL